jgi:hypothetical protein
MDGGLFSKGIKYSCLPRQQRVHFGNKTFIGHGGKGPGDKVI